MQSGDRLTNGQTKQEKPGIGLRMAQLSIRRPVTICMVLACFLVLGAVSIAKIPLVLAPDISFPFVGVHVPYPNATPGQVQETIAKPIEEALATVPHVQLLGSRSSENSAFIDMTFNWGEDVEWLRSQVREKIEQIRGDLPADVDKIYVRNFSTDDIPILEGRISSRRDLRNAFDFLDLKIKKPLERVPGVAEVELYGAQRKEVDIYLRLDDIKRYRVDVGSLFRRLDAANLNVSLGRVVDGGLRYGAISRGVLRSLEDIRNFPVNDRGLKLRDIADVSFDAPALSYGRHLNGEFAIGFQMRKTSQANTVETVNHVMAQMEQIRNDPSLEGTQILVWHDAGREITKSLRGLLNAGTIGALLAVVILYLFLRRLGATLAIGFAIPFSIISTIGFLYLLGKTLNVLSMMGLMLATGMLVDNAVVVLESIYQHLEKGKDRVSAACIGTKEVITAVTAATLTSIIIFVPLVFGKKTNLSIWLGDTGAAIIVALLCSLFISLTLIPLGMGKLLRIDMSAKSRFEVWWSERLAPLFRKPGPWLKAKLLRRRRQSGAAPEPAGNSSGLRHWVTEHYLVSVAWCLRHRVVVGAFLVPLVMIVSFLQLKKVPDNSPEAQDLQDLSIQYEFSENYHYAKVEQDYVTPVERFLLKNRERFKIKDVYSTFSNNEAQTRVYFDKDNVTLEELQKIRPQIAKELPVIPGGQIKLGRQEGAQSQTWIGVNLYGEDSATLQQLCREARRRLRAKPGFVEVHNDLDRGKEEVQIKLDRALARKYNISPESVAGILGIVVRGREVRGYRTSEGEVDIWVRLQASDRRNLEDLRSIVVGAGPDGQDIHLSQVAHLDIVKTPGVIQREDRRTYTWMWVNYAGDKKDEGKKLLTQVMDSLDYPSGYGWSFGFWTKRREKEDNEFLFNILLALFMVYLVMASLFESLAHPFAIMLSLPFAMVGVTWGLLITGTPFNLMAKIGLLVLIGIVVNNGIVLLDHVNNLRRTGRPRAQAVLDACRERFRPILMTASTTIVGLIPLAIGTSGIFELRYFPLARTVMAGLMSSTILTLIVLPTYYTVFDDLAAWLRRTWHSSNPAPATAKESPAYGD